MIKVIGIGPGGKEDMTPRALNAILEADTVAGYNTYIKLIKHLLDGKNVIGTGMMQEVDRCKMAIEEAVKGHNVAVVSSGDSGVYGMAGIAKSCISGAPNTAAAAFTAERPATI